MKTAPDPKDIQEFQFKQSHISQIVDAFASIPISCSLLTADKKRGLLYVGQNNKIFILKPGEDSEPEWKIEVEVPVVISKLTLSCDCSYLAVVPHGPSVLIYDVQALIKGNLQLLHEIRISTTSVDAFVSDLQWNPTVPGMLCTVASDYTVGSFQVKEGKEKTIELKALQKLNGLDVLCAAWSPKGKQIVVGCKNGNIVQLKPDLEVARMIPGPNPYIGEVVSLLWISNYQFCAAYLGSEQRINVLIIDAPKGETNAIFTCYEDITYGMTDAENGMITRYYFDHVPEWGLIIAASSNSSEIAVLGSADGGATWSQWQLVDSGRAELPLICTTESYPVGIAIDKSSNRNLPWGADATLPNPVPILHILSTSGQLCSFHMINLFPNCPAINIPPTEIVSTPPQSRVSITPAEASIIMNGLATSTPRPKQQEAVAERPKPPPTGNMFDKLLKGNNFFAQPALEKPKQQEQKPEPPVAEIKIDPPKEIVPPEPVKPVVTLTPVKETIPQEPVEQKTTVEDESRDIRAYIEEHNLFEKELRNRLEPQTWIECGTEEERQKLVEASAIIDQFLRELRETTNSLSSDIAYLKALLLQSFAWVEEAKSKNAATNNIATRNCGDNNKISDLQQLYFYTQTQLTQASKILDLEWLDNKSQEMSRMKIPHLEFVYQNLILHNKIIQKEKGKVEQLKKQWKLITRSNNIFGLNRSLSSLSIASSKSSATLPRNAGIIEARCKTIALKTLSFTQEKQIKLREHLSTSATRVIKPVNPTPIQHRLEATLSSLASLGNTSADSTIANTVIGMKSKLEQSVSKQSPIAKQVAEKPKQQSPLASLNSIVARIGANEISNSKAQSKQPIFTNTFSAAAGSKPMQTDKKSTLPIAVTPPQSSKPKQDTIPFGQANSSLPNLMKSFPKVDSISFGAPVQKPEDISIQKSLSKESSIKLDKEPIQSSIFKADSNIFGTGALKDAISPDTMAGKTQGIAPASLKFGLPITTTPTKSDAATTFSFATPNAASLIAKSISQPVTPQTTAAQSFSFASKPSSASTPFNLKLTPTTTAAQTQESLNLTNIFSGLQAFNQTLASSSETSADEKLNFVKTFKLQMAYLQDATASGQLTVGLGNGIPKENASSVVIEEITSPTELKVPTLPTSSVQPLPATSAACLFTSQTTASTIPRFGEATSSTPATATFAGTTSSNAFGIQTATTSPISIFGGFSNTTATSTVATTSGTASPFQTTLAKPTFGAAATVLSTPSSTPATTSTPSTLTFGSVTTTATTTVATSVFDKPALSMTTPFSSAPAVSSSSNAFGKPIISPASIPFGSTANASIFGGVSTTTTKAASMFSNSNTTSIFGASTQTSSAGSIFGGSASTTNTFGTPQKSIFDNAEKSGSIFGESSYTTNFFGGAAANTSQGVISPGSSSVFGGGANLGANTSLGMEQPVIGTQTAFGQAPSFENKPVFGSPPAFGGAKPVFGGGFGATTFGAGASPPAFGSPPAMGGTAAPIDNMPKVFGNMGGNTTFESLASQSSGLSFGSLAQKSPEAEKPSVFTGGSSFSNWR